MKITPFTPSLLVSLTLAQQFVQYTPGTDDTSIERIDPIMAPGVIGQHVHQVFGSNALQPLVTYNSLQSAACSTVGDASGRGNSQDRSIYWHPALYMELKDGSGFIKLATQGHKLYYQNRTSPGDTLREPFEFPEGFRMLAGNPFMRAPAEYLQMQNITQWICHMSNGPPNQGTAGGFPTGITACDAYPYFNGAIHFPDCWNGNAFDQLNPTAHMAYPIGDISSGACPPSHRIRLPHIFIENNFDLTSVQDVVKPDSFVLAQGDNTGYGWHADFFNGWVTGALPELFATCPQPEYGNEDIGTCPSFKPLSTSVADCRLPTYFKEHVKSPGQFLPGCNPVVDKNPAPYYKTAALGTYTDKCSVIPNIDTPSGKTSPSAPPTKISANVECPSSNGHVYEMPNDKTFQITCETDHIGGDLIMVGTATLEDCVLACAANSKCVAVALSGAACYLKSILGEPQRNVGVNGAVLVKSRTSKERREKTAMEWRA